VFLPQLLHLEIIPYTPAQLQQRIPVSVANSIENIQPASYKNCSRQQNSAAFQKIFSLIGAGINNVHASLPFKRFQNQSSFVFVYINYHRKIATPSGHFYAYSTVLGCSFRGPIPFPFSFLLSNLAKISAS
jgi:hypothetical protein